MFLVHGWTTSWKVHVPYGIRVYGMREFWLSESDIPLS